MNKEIDSSKSQYEEQINQFKEIISKFDAEKAYLVEDLKSKHRLEIENLKLGFNSNKDSFNAEKLKLQEAHNSELAKLHASIEDLKTKQAMERQDYENNMKKLSSLHEKELNALKSNTNSEFLNQINNLKGEIEKIRNEKFESEKELTKRYESKLEEIIGKDEEIEVLKDKLKNIQGTLETSRKDVTAINDELIEARIECQKMQKKLAELENDNQKYKESNDKQIQQLMEKSSKMHSRHKKK